MGPVSISAINLYGNMQNKKSVCVVGGGIAGLISAYVLKKKGHDVVVYEKTDRVGGKCYTEDVEGGLYELGACSVCPTYTRTMKFARELGEKLRTRLEFYNLSSGKSQRLSSFRKEYNVVQNLPRILYELPRYCFHSMVFNFRTRNGFSHIGKGYDVPFSDWCKKHDFKVIPDWFELPVVAFGYGDFSQIKTFYVLEYIEWPISVGMLFMYLTGVTMLKRFKNGYGGFAGAVAKQVEHRTSVEIEEIQRTATGVVVRSNLGVHEFDSLVIACPLSQLTGVLKPSKDEERIVKETSFYPYRLIVCDIENLPKGNFLIRENLGTKGIGHVSLIERESQPKASVCYVPEDSFEKPWDETMSVLRADVEKLGARVAKVHTQIKWSYFPHGSSLSFLDSINKIQGKQNTYYVGGMCSFELVEPIVAHAEKTMDIHFSGVLPKERFTLLKNALDWISST